MHGDLGSKLYRIIALSSFLLLIGIWWGVAAAGLVDPLFLPGPGAVVSRFDHWLLYEGLLYDTGISLYRVMAGFALSAIMAVPLGLYIGAYQPVRAFFEPLMEFSRYLPAVAFVPLVLLWAGIGEGSKIALIWIGTFFQMVLMISDDAGAPARDGVSGLQPLPVAERGPECKVLPAAEGAFPTAARRRPQ